VSEPDPPSRPVPAWRIILGVSVLVALTVIGTALAPVYFRNAELGKSLRELPPAASDAALQQVVIEKGRSLGLEIAPDHVQVKHSPDTGRVNVHYVVRVNFSLYTVDLHFSSKVGDPANGRP
jgi:hypothetical protein